MRVIVRRERPHPGAQLRITDPGGLRYTAFATNTRPGGPGRQLADLELRHRRRAPRRGPHPRREGHRADEPALHELDQNRIWCAIVALACEITAWTQMLAYTEHPARRWEPKRLRLRLFSTPAQIARHARPDRAAPAGAFTLVRAAMRRPHPTPCTRRPRLSTTPPPRRPRNPDRPWTRRPPVRPRLNCHTLRAELHPAHRPSTGVDQDNASGRKIRANWPPAGTSPGHPRGPQPGHLRGLFHGHGQGFAVAPSGECGAESREGGSLVEQETRVRQQLGPGIAGQRKSAADRSGL
jgi:hypothetical protein